MTTKYKRRFNKKELASMYFYCILRQLVENRLLQANTTLKLCQRKNKN